MNRKSLIAAAALAAASLSTYAADGREAMPEGSVSADTHPGSMRSAEPITTPSGSLSREEVKAELRELKAEGLHQEVTEASPSALDEQARNQKLAQIYGEDRVSQAIAERDGLMALADREDEAPIVIIESAPVEATPDSGPLPYDHPAVRDGSPSDEAPQVPIQ